jgi:hypothetical protein
LNEPASSRLRYLIHRLGVEISCQVPALLEPLGRALGEFSVGSLPVKSAPISGTIRPFGQAEVLRYLSPTATRVTGENQLVELYEEGERFWLIDDHWGLCEVNVLKGQWRSWILPDSTCDPYRLVENAVLWPAAQLLRTRGLCMIPSAAAVVRDGWGALILSTFSIEPELSLLARAGFRIVGQNWTALREEAGKIAMLHLPGSVERLTPRPPGIVSAHETGTHRVDLNSEYCGSSCEMAWCDAVIVIAPGRRPLPHLRAITQANSVGVLRRCWPIAELHPHRRQGQLPARIAQKCRVFDAQLSRNPQDILSLMETARYQRLHHPFAPATAPRESEQQRVVA